MNQRGLPLRSYIICALPRTGSNLLCLGLRSTGVAGNPAEYFLHLHQDKGPLPSLKLLSVNPFNGMMYEKGSSKNGVFGISVMREGFAAAMKFYRSDRQFSGLGEMETLREVFPNPRFIYITRRDKVRQAVSMAKALKTGCFTSIEEDAEKSAGRYRYDLDYDERSIAYYWRLFLEQEEEWEAFFRRNHLSPFRLVYEEFADDQERYLREVLRFLDIEYPEDSPLDVSALRRQTDEISEQWVERFKAAHSSEI